MSPVPARQFSPKKGAAVKRLKRWRSCPIPRNECVSGVALVARQWAAPGSVWPPRPRQHYRQARTRGEVARLVVDLVQEQSEKGAAGVMLAASDLVELAGRSLSTCRRALAEACRLGLLDDWPMFEQATAAAANLKRAPKGRQLGHVERRKLYVLGPAALVELQRLADARRRPPGWHERQTARAFSIERARARRRARDFSVIGEQPIRDQKPEEATEEAQTALRAESVAPAAPPERLSRCAPSGPCASAPPLELRNSWTREAASPPPRRKESATTAPAAASPRVASAPTLPVVRTLRGGDPTDDPGSLDAMLARLRARYGDG